MIIQSIRLKKLGKKYGSKDFYFSSVYSSDLRTAILVDGGSRLFTFPIPLNTLLGQIDNCPLLSSIHFEGCSIIRSLTWIKIYLTDGVKLFFKIKDIQSFIK